MTVFWVLVIGMVLALALIAVLVANVDRLETENRRLKLRNLHLVDELERCSASHRKTRAGVR